MRHNHIFSKMDTLPTELNALIQTFVRDKIHPTARLIKQLRFLSVVNNDEPEKTSTVVISYEEGCFFRRQRGAMYKSFIRKYYHIEFDDRLRNILGTERFRKYIDCKANYQDFLLDFF